MRFSGRTTLASAAVVAAVLAVPSTVLAASARDRATHARVWGVTLDDVTHTRSLARSLDRLPERTMARVVFDPGMPPSSYAGALRHLHPVADVLGQPVDPSETASYSVRRYRARFAAYVAAFPTVRHTG